MNEVTVVVLAVLAIGVWKAWKEISTGSGFLGSRFSQQTLVSLNSKEGRAKKMLLALLLGYVVFGVVVIKLILKIAIRGTDGHF